MVISGGQFTVLDRILQIILNKFGWQELFKAGVPSTYQWLHLTFIEVNWFPDVRQNQTIWMVISTRHNVDDMNELTSLSNALIRVLFGKDMGYRVISL